MENLVLIDVPTKYLGPDFKEWAKDTRPFFAESCGRQLVLCTREYYEGLPHNKRVRFENPTHRKGHGIYFGADASQRLLEIYCGLHSNTHKDYHIAGQISRAWLAHCDKLTACDQVPEQTITTVMENIFQDGKIVKSQLIDPYVKHQEYLPVLAEELKLNGTQTVVVIADTFITTRDVCRALGKDNKKRAAKLVVTHFDDTSLNRIAAGLSSDRSQSKKKIVSDVRPIPFSQAIDAIIDADIVIMCPHMQPDAKVAQEKSDSKDNFGNYSDALQCEEAVMNAWRIRAEKSSHNVKPDTGVLAHISGSANRQETTQHWEDFMNEFRPNQYAHILTREALNEISHQRELHNRAVISDAFTAIEKITEGRSKGLEPKGIKVTATKELYQGASAFFRSVPVGRDPRNDA